MGGVFVTGATGTVGSAVFDHLLRLGEPVIAGIRDPLDAQRTPASAQTRAFVPAGRSRTAFIDARDVGHAAAVTLAQPGHVGKAYTLSGEQSLSYRNVAQIMTDALGRPIRYDRPSENAYLTALSAAGAAEDYIAVQKMIHKVVRLNVSAFPNRSIRTLTGKPPITLRQFVDDYKDVWKV